MDLSIVVDRSGHNTAKYRRRKAVFGRDDLLPMWLADMDFCAPSFITEAIYRRTQHPIFGSVDKPDTAIAAQIKWMQRRQHFTVEKDWVLSTHSVVSAIHMAIQAFSDIGDEVIIMAPVYHEFANSVKQENRVLISWALDKVDGRYEFSIEKLKKQISSRTKILILCSPQNPIGRVWSQQELQTIGNFCIEHNIMIVADEIHGDLVYSPRVFYPMAALSPEISAQCMSIQGPGKTFNLTGLALSSIIISNSKLRESFTKVHQQFHPSYGTVFTQVAFEAAYLYGDQWVDDLLIYLNDNQKLLQAMLLKHSDKISMSLAEATFLAWLDCSKMQLSDKATAAFFVDKAKLGLNPGVQFGVGGEQHMRLNFAVPVSVMQQAIEQLDDALSSF